MKGKGGVVSTSGRCYRKAQNGERVNYYCPLCLEELVPGKSQLLRFCRVHPDLTKCIDIDTVDMTSIFCPGDHLTTDCNLGKVDVAPLLLHVDCKQDNPFWDGNRFDIPQVVYYKLDPTSTNTGTATLKHWQLDAMREVPDNFRINRPMWFPQALFRVFHEQQQNLGLASTVLLLGGQAAGKSVLATMALRPETWRGSLPGGGFFEASGFLYVSPPPAAQVKEEEFVANLAAVIRGPGVLIAETSALDRNIRALFLRYEPQANAQAGDTCPSQGGLQIFNGKNLGVAFKSLGRTAKAFWGRRSGSRSSPASTAQIPPPISAVVFYDLKGETVDVPTGPLLRLIQNLQRIAVVISAADLSGFGGQAGSTQITNRRNSADVALELLERVDTYSKPISVVITHIDEVRQNNDPTEWKEYWKNHNSNPRNYHPPNINAERELLCQVLEKGNSTENSISTLLKRRPKWPVHFVWTENIDTANRYSVGIHSFVAEWCLQGLKVADPTTAGR